MMKVWDVLKKVFAIIAMFVFLIPGVVEDALHETDGGLAYVRTEIFLLEQALIRGQGLTTDGESYYFSGTYSLTKTKLNPQEVLVEKPIAIPLELLVKGSNHIGGISYYDGKIYAAIEDGGDYLNPHIVIFNAETLECEKIYDLPVSTQWEGQELMLHMDGVPWCAVDAKRGCLYTAEWSTAEYLNVFDLATMEFVKVVKLSQELDRIQGAEVYDGNLYLSSDNHADGKQIFKLDPVTGVAELFGTRYVGEGAEAEGMTVYPMADGTLFHVIDVFTSRVGLSMHHYASTIK